MVSVFADVFDERPTSIPRSTRIGKIRVCKFTTIILDIRNGGSIMKHTVIYHPQRTYFYRISCARNSRKAAHFLEYSGHISDSANVLIVGTAWRFVVETHRNSFDIYAGLNTQIRQYNHDIIVIQKIEAAR